MGTKRTNSKLRYIMVIVGACLMAGMTYFMTSALVYYYDAVCAEFGFSRTAFSIYYTIMTIVGTFGNVVVLQKIYPKLGARKLLIIFGSIVGVAYMSFSRCRQLWQFYLLAALVGFCGQVLCCGGLTVLMIHTWFHKKQGTLIGITSSMTGVTGMLLSVPMAQLINTNWRNGYLLCGGIFIVVSLLAGILLFRNKPSDCGMQPYGYTAEKAAEPAKLTASTAIQGIPLKKATKSIPFWLICVAIVFLGFELGFGQNNFKFFTELGFDTVSAASFLSIMSGAMVVWSFVLGFLSDKLGPKKTWVLAMFVTVFGIVLQVVNGASSAIVPYIFVICCACSSSTVSVLNPATIKEIFGDLDYSAILPLVSIPSGISSALCSTIWSLLYDVTGSYTLCILLSVVALVSVALLFVAAFRLSKTNKFQSMLETKQL